MMTLMILAILTVPFGIAAIADVIRKNVRGF